MNKALRSHPYNVRHKEIMDKQKLCIDLILLQKGLNQLPASNSLTVTLLQCSLTMDKNALDLVSGSFIPWFVKNTMHHQLIN